MLVLKASGWRKVCLGITSRGACFMALSAKSPRRPTASAIGLAKAGWAVVQLFPDPDAAGDYEVAAVIFGFVPADHPQTAAMAEHFAAHLVAMRSLTW